MKRIIALLLALCLTLPLCAGASRTRITSYTEAEWDAVNSLFQSLDDRVWTDGVESLTADERLLYITMNYNGLMLSGGLDSVFTFMSPEEIADIPTALRFVGAEEHAAQFEAFMEQTFLRPELLHLLSPLFGFLGNHLQPFEAQNASFIALDEEVALTSIIFQRISTTE